MDNKITLAYLYPDILNLHGDKGNVLAFKRVAGILGLDIEIIRIDNLNEKLDFSKYDIVLLSPGELKVMESITKNFNDYKEDIDKFIEDEKYFITIGTTGSILSKEIIFEDKRKIKGLNYFDMIAKERSFIYGDDILFKTNIEKNPMEICACQIDCIDINYTGEVTPFGEVIYGSGNDSTNKEGARYKNLIYTNALGPVFIKNPWLTKEILLDIASKKGIPVLNSNTDFSLEENSMNAIKEFINKKVK